MENASKFLLIAGGLLVGILTITLIFNLYRNSGGLFSAVDERLSNTELQNYNRPFTKLMALNDENEDITIYDIITVTNYAKDINSKLEGKNDLDYITIFLSNEGLQEKSQAELNDFVKNNQKQKYKITDFNYNSNGKVVKVVFNNK